MKTTAQRTIAIVIVGLAFITSGHAGSKKSEPAKTVDQGTFGVFVNGQHVGTETFSIMQSDSENVVKQQFKMDAAKVATVSSEMRLSPAGDILRYEWHGDEGKSSSVVTPDEQLLKQTMVLSGVQKPIERQYIIPPSTTILDDYAFVHREILAWRFIAIGCAKGTDKGCALAPEQFGIFIPTEQASAFAKVEFVGREKVQFKGAEKEMSRFNMRSEATGDWQIWLDDDHKMMRILIPETKTEVVRD